MYRLLQRGPRSEIIELFTGKMLQLLLLRNLLHLIVIELINMFREKRHLFSDIFVQVQGGVRLVHSVQILAVLV